MRKSASESFNVYFGRGGATNQLRKNSLYRGLLVESCVAYGGTPVRHRRQYAYEKVVQGIQANGGRFYQVEKGKDPVEITDLKVILTRVMQALRDCLREGVGRRPLAEEAPPSPAPPKAASTSRKRRALPKSGRKKAPKHKKKRRQKEKETSSTPTLCDEDGAAVPMFEEATKPNTFATTPPHGTPRPHPMSQHIPAGDYPRASELAQDLLLFSESESMIDCQANRFATSLKRVGDVGGGATSRISFGDNEIHDSDHAGVFDDSCDHLASVASPLDMASRVKRLETLVKRLEGLVYFLMKENESIACDQHATV